MGSILKKVGVAIAAKQIFDLVQDKRQARRPSLGSRLAKWGLIGAAGAGIAYLVSSGKAQELAGKAKGGGGSLDAASNGHSADVTFRSEDQPVSTPV